MLKLNLFNNSENSIISLVNDSVFFKIEGILLDLKIVVTIFSKSS